MKHAKRNKIIAMLSLLLIAAGCTNGAGGKNVSTEKPGETITVIENADKENDGRPLISVVKIDQFKGIEITDWLNEHTLIVSRENTSLDKMTMSEVSETYPISLYTYDIEKEEFRLLKELAGGNLGGAALSSDHETLLFHEFTVGDPAFYIMNMDDASVSSLSPLLISEAMSAKWADDDTVIGASYRGGAYIADPSGSVTQIVGLEDESLIITEKIGDHIYYTLADETLHKMNLTTKETTSLGLNRVYSLTPSPDGKQILVIQTDGAKITLALYDTDGGNRKVIHEGLEINGVSWSKDQRMIAYHLKSDANGGIVNGLYIHDMLTGETSQIAVDVQPNSTLWSPSGEELVFTEVDGTISNSSVVYLKYSLSK